MNKFIVIKCRTGRALQDMKKKISKFAVGALSYHPTHVRVQEFRDSLILACSFEIRGTAGFNKKYTYSKPNKFVAIDGLPLKVGFDPSGNLAEQIGESWKSDKGLLETVFGTWAGVKIENGTIKVFSDFTGMTPLYRASTNDYIAFSTRQTLLSECVLDGARDLESLGWLVAQTNVIGDRMPARGVTLVPPGYTTTIDGAKGVFEARETKRELYLNRNKIDEKEAFDDAAVDRAIDSLLQQANAIADLPLKSVELDITGGLDSRLVLATALSSNLRNKIKHLQTRGPENGFEIQVGRSIAEEMDCKFKTILRGGKDIGDRKRAVTRCLNMVRSNSFRFEGSLCLSDANNPVSKTSTITLTGSAGEIYRRHCKPHMNLDIRSVTQFMDTYTDYHHKTDPLSVLRPEAGVEYRKKLQAYALDYLDMGAEYNDVSDIFFMKYRLPHWNGVIGSNLYGSTKVYPLVNYELGKLAFSGGYKHRVTDRLHFEIMARLNPKLTSMPFFKFAWPAGFNKTAQRLGFKNAEKPFQVTGTPSMTQKNSQLQLVGEDGLPDFIDYLLSFPGSDLWNIVSKHGWRRLSKRARRSATCRPSRYSRASATWRSLSETSMAPRMAFRRPSSGWAKPRRKFFQTNERGPCLLIK